jgi:geranylgeranyl reductase family protein
MTKPYDLIIVGGGPAGSSAGIVASRMGLSTIILEAKSKGRDKYCGGGLTILSQKTLKDIGASEALESIELYAEGHVVVLPSGKVIVDKLKEGSYGLVRRSVFDQKLQEIAQSYGADIIYNFRVSNVSTETDKVIVKNDKGETIEGKYLIIASGVTDNLPDILGFPPRPGKEYMGHCWGTETSYPVDAELPNWQKAYGFTPIFLLFGFVTYGYLWIFPKKNHLNVGAGTTLKESEKYGKSHLEVFQKGLKLARELGILSQPAPLKVDRGWLIPGKPRALTYSVKRRALLVGDAAGFVHPLTGEGISGALRSGNIAANTIKEALDKEEPGILASYQERWWKDFGEDAYRYGIILTRIMYTHPYLQRFSLDLIYSDEKAIRLLSSLLGRTDTTATKKLYDYIVKHFPELLIKKFTKK